MAAQALEQSVLETKDKDQLLAISKALGVKVTARSKKADIISAILATTGGSSAGDATDQPTSSGAKKASTSGGDRSATSATEDAPAETTGDSTASARSKKAAEAAPAPATDEEPPAEWELEFSAEPAEDVAKDGSSERGGQNRDGQQRDGQRQQRNGQRDGQRQDGSRDADGESRNRRRRRRRKGGRPDEGPQGEDRDFLEDDDTPVSNDPVPVDGYLDMRDEGYGFVRVNNYLSSKKDAYVPVRMSRQFGLRKGDHLVGMMRPAGRNEKNPAMLEIQTVNGRPPEEAKKRRKFEDMTALFPDEKLRLENEDDPTDMTSRIIDLICPIGKGQRGLIVSPPKAGKTTVMKTIATSIERNNPEVRLIVLLIDERPEEVTDMQRHVRGEVIASTFDRPSDQHTQVAEMAIEKAKRMVEYGEDVVIILDGITRLSRAYNLAAPASGRILSGGIDAGALYPPKRFFGAARNIEEGGSLTILATALVETNSRMDEAVFEEFKGTGNMELRLDRKLSERRVYPAIDVDASSTRHEELLFDRKQLQMVWKLRRVLSGLAADGSAAPGLELLVDRLKTFRTNDEFLTEIAKQPGM
ncbi:MAG: transcription termination factor Rho [Actinomycetota bacterium]|nr:transcription termination factor Rho [Actinomycetota bacterium]MEC8520741.1 transcription termination factor Rho [Actinomycetota bacterium]MEC9225396.1 transcription termination factor Rho [Actinomycetota bacterium]MED5328852.1 transcription termination factor Rho [Actinomycetota bacterium]